MTARPPRSTAAALEQAAAERERVVRDALDEAVRLITKVAGPYQSAGWNDAVAKAAKAVADFRDGRQP